MKTTHIKKDKSNQKKQEVNMSLNKAIQSGKEHRKPYRGCKAIDATCRNHGTDLFSMSDRLYKNTKRLNSMEDRLREEQL